MSKDDFLHLLGNDDLDAVVKHLLAYARTHDLSELYSDAVIQSGQLEAYKKASRAGTASFDQLAQQRAVVRQSLLDMVNGLPAIAPVKESGGRKKGLSELLFKRLLFWGMVLGKAMVMCWLLFQGDTGGFSSREVGVTISMLLPVFTAYLTPMVSEFLDNRYVSAYPEDKPQRRLSWMLPAVTFLIILPLYFGLMIYFIHQRGEGTAQSGDVLAALRESKNLFEQMTGNIMLLETAIGVYIGMIVNALFDRGDRNAE